jgi:hypothetical protein
MKKRFFIFFTIASTLIAQKTIDAQEVALVQLKGCSVCYDDKEYTEFKKLTCDHEFCKDCFYKMFHTTIKDQDSCHLRCPEKTCRKSIDPLLLDSIAPSDEQAGVLQRIIFKNFMESQPHLKNCPTFNCSHFFLTLPRYTKMCCPECNEEYCRNCTLPHEKNVSCHKARTAHKIKLEDLMTLAQKEAARKSEEWAKQNTKSCPGCKFTFTPDGGCTKMRCPSCRSIFALNPKN